MTDTTIHRAELAGYSSVVGQPIMLLNKAEACIGQLSLIGAQGDYKAMTAEVAMLINGDALRAEVERLWYVLGGVASAIDAGRNEPLVIWREQIEIARAAPKGGDA